MRQPRVCGEQCEEQTEEREFPSVELYRSRIEQAGLPEPAREEAERELVQLASLDVQSAEAGEIRTHLEWMTALPWSILPGGEIDLARVSAALSEDHYGVAKARERILEFLAVRALQVQRQVPSDDSRGTATTLCLIGPPGVGMGNLGRSLARALDREFIRVSVAGTYDDADIRGSHRGGADATPGLIVQALRRVGTRNAIVMVDGVDRMSADWRSGAAEALLDVIDAGQSQAFRDRYVGAELDLSQVVFICTATTLSGIPPVLRDRLEFVLLDGYTEYDKVHIAQQYLVPQQLAANGLQPEELSFSEDALRTIIRDYTYEAGVAGLEREIRRVVRAAAVQVVLHGSRSGEPITPERVHELLGAPRYCADAHLRTQSPGVAMSLAWTPGGGDVVFVEARVTRNTHYLILTGQLGDVMRESAQIALSYVEGELERLGLPPDALEDRTVHFHLPTAAVPKDGPSAGVALVTALVSHLTDQPVRPGVAMTGELTLQGHVLPVGNIRQKVLVAHQLGLHTVILPRDNEADLEDIPLEIRAEMSLVLVDHVDQVLDVALTLPVEYEAVLEPYSGGPNTGGNGHNGRLHGSA